MFVNVHQCSTIKIKQLDQMLAFREPKKKFFLILTIDIVRTSRHQQDNGDKHDNDRSLLFILVLFLSSGVEIFSTLIEFLVASEHNFQLNIEQTYSSSLTTWICITCMKMVRYRRATRRARRQRRRRKRRRGNDCRVYFEYFLRLYSIWIIQ
jgi:uncharacterized membrane protein